MFAYWLNLRTYGIVILNTSIGRCASVCVLGGIAVLGALNNVMLHMSGVNARLGPIWRI